MTRILVPPGIGDAYWVMVKLRGFLKEHGLDMPDVVVQDGGGPQRTEGFIRSVPFVRAAGYHRVPLTHKGILHEAYRRDGRTVFTEVPGVDFFLSYNGVLGAGRSLEEVDPTFGTEWHPPLVVSERSLEFERSMRQGGPYVAVYFPDGGFYRSWWSGFGPQRTQESLEQIRDALGVRIVFLGAAWDVGSMGWLLADAEPSTTWVNLIGKTDYDQMVGLLRGARAVVGYPSGATILPAVWYVPTVLFWHKYFPTEFWRNVVAPDSPYTMLDVEGLTVERVVEAVRELVETSHARGPDHPTPVPR